MNIKTEDYEKKTCKKLLLVLKSMVSAIPLRYPNISFVFILVDRVLQSFENSEQQNLDEFTADQLKKSLNFPTHFAYDNVVDIIDLMTGGRDFYGNIRSINCWSGNLAKNVNQTIEKAIDSAITSQKSLVEWILGYEIKAATLPSARVEIYWIVKDAAEKARVQVANLKHLQNRKPMNGDTKVFPILRSRSKSMENLPGGHFYRGIWTSVGPQPILGRFIAETYRHNEI